MGAQVRDEVAEALGEHDLSWPTYSVLQVLAHVHGTSQMGLAERTCIDRTRISTVVAALERTGLIERDRDRDRRRQIIFASDAGRDLAGQARYDVEHAERTALVPLRARDVTRLMELLSQVMPQDRDLWGFRRA